MVVDLKAEGIWIWDAYLCFWTCSNNKKTPILFPKQTSTFLCYSVNIQAEGNMTHSFYLDVGLLQRKGFISQWYAWILNTCKVSFPTIVKVGGTWTFSRDIPKHEQLFCVQFHFSVCLYFKTGCVCVFSACHGCFCKSLCIAYVLYSFLWYLGIQCILYYNIISLYIISKMALEQLKKSTK